MGALRSYTAHFGAGLVGHAVGLKIAVENAQAHFIESAIRHIHETVEFARVVELVVGPLGAGPIVCEAVLVTLAPEHGVEEAHGKGPLVRDANETHALAEPAYRHFRLLLCRSPLTILAMVHILRSRID